MLKYLLRDPRLMASTRQTVTPDEFLELEEEARRIARLRSPAREVRRFHAAVRRFASAWNDRPGRRITATNSTKGVLLHLEIEDQYGWVAVFNLRAAHPRGEFGLKGPNPERKRIKMTGKLRKSMDSLNKAWRDLPGIDQNTSQVSVTVQLPKIADSGFDRFLEVALEHTAEV
jgi:hypothetical protein